MPLWALPVYLGMRWTWASQLESLMMDARTAYLTLRSSRCFSMSGAASRSAAPSLARCASRLSPTFSENHEGSSRIAAHSYRLSRARGTPALLAAEYAQAWPRATTARSDSGRSSYSAASERWPPGTRRRISRPSWRSA